MKPSPRSPRRLLILSGLTLAWALSGCAALQIDVDVYKGPLVHDEDTQIQQLASIAMSAKTLLLLQRNTGLDVESPKWREEVAKFVIKHPDRNPMAGHIQRDDWLEMNLCTGAEKACRNARLINDMLSAYDDRVQPELAAPLDAVRIQYKLYKSARDAYGKAVKAKKPVDEQEAAERTNAALRETWRALVDLLYESKRRRPDHHDAIFKSVERQSAELLAKLTEPSYLLCAADVLLKGGEISRILGPMYEVVNEGGPGAKDAGAKRAITFLHGALVLASTDELLDLRRAAGVAVKNVCEPSVSVNASRTEKTALSRQTARFDSVAKSASRQGVQREGTGSRGDALDDDLDEIDTLWGDLMQLGAAGFDRGRPQLGLDRLADEAAIERFKDRGRRGDADKLTALADSDQTKQLQDSAVDLASRMQFLAVNMQLVEGAATVQRGKEDGSPFIGTQPSAAGNEEGFKATLESIANTLLVLAEDQRRQRTHRTHQEKFAGDEYRSAVEAFQVDATRRFDQLIDSVRTEFAAQVKMEKALAAQREVERVAAKKALDAATAKLASTQQEQDAYTDLHITLLGIRPAALPGAAPVLLWVSADTPARWKQDQASLDAEFASSAPAITTAQALRDIAAAWITKQLAENKSAATDTDPRRTRLAAAQVALQKLSTTKAPEQVRAKALEQFKGDLLLALQLAREKTALAQAVVTEADTQFTQARTSSEVKITAGSTPPSSIDLQAVLDILKAQGAAVVAAAAAAKDAHSTATIAGLLSAVLAKAKAAVSVAKQGPYTLAEERVASWLKDAPEDLKVLGKQPATAQNTLDRIEAYLSYRRVDAVAREGATSAKAKELTQAMDALMKRRERMAYLRPASMYLRSALATTGQQADPGLEWKNLLWDTVSRMTGTKSDAEKQTEAVRATLDKSFWQSVNKVRVSAAGDSNFAIAKDDIGNWYVKAMGSDSEAMIKAAKGLALYNLGGRVDANLLRIDELRSKAEPTQAETRELDQLRDRKNGAAAGAYGSTLLVFTENHAKTVKGLLATLNEDLKAKRHFDAISARWAKTYADSAAKLALLPPTLLDEKLLKLHDLALTAATPADPQPAGTTPSSQLIETLDLLVQQRSLLKARVAEIKALTVDEVAAAKLQNDKVTVQENLLSTAQTEQTALLQKRLALQDQRDLLFATSPTKVDELKVLDTQITEQQKAANSKSQDVINLRVKLQKEQVDAVKLNSLADAARALQARAVDDVETVLHKLIKDAASKHLRAVEEFETAARVVSQGVQGNPASK